ncbi:hypothetical protein GMMP1_100080 [Candidatus Magnetomoraceae bacterium gMMP-1]
MNGNMADHKKWIKIIDNLNRMTQEGILKWKRSDPPRSLIDLYNKNIDYIYTARDPFDGRLLRLYRGLFYNHTLNIWTKELILEFIDESGKSEWQFPYFSVTSDLIKSVRYQTARVNSFLDSYDKKMELKNFSFQKSKKLAQNNI